MLEASQIFNVASRQSELRRLDKAPDEVVRRLVQAMDSVSRALTERPGSGGRMDAQGAAAPGADGV